MNGPFGRRSGPVEPSLPADPEPQQPAAAEPPLPPRGISSVTWILGVLVVLALAYITLNTLRTEGPGSRGIREGEPLPAFAVPLVSGDMQGDAQVDPGKACAIRGPAILNSCELREQRVPLALAFVATRSEQCEDQVDVLDRVAAGNRDVRFAAVGIRGERADLARVARERGWRMPVAHDRDGAVANLFAVAVCPTITFVEPGGAVSHTSLGLIDAAEIERRIQALR